MKTFGLVTFLCRRVGLIIALVSQKVGLRKSQEICVCAARRCGSNLRDVAATIIL